MNWKIYLPVDAIYHSSFSGRNFCGYKIFRTPTQILVVTPPVCRLHIARWHVSCKHATHATFAALPQKKHPRHDYFRKQVYFLWCHSRNLCTMLKGVFKLLSKTTPLTSSSDWFTWPIPSIWYFVGRLWTSSEFPTRVEKRLKKGGHKNKDRSCLNAYQTTAGQPALTVIQLITLKSRYLGVYLLFVRHCFG